MELRHLRYFIAVAEEENVSRAALKLHVSQPALSRQIRDLEDELGFSLLKRGAKSVRLTDAGRTFLIEARAVLQRAEQGVKAARAAATGMTSEIHVGYAPSLTARILPPTLRAFQSEQAGWRVVLHDLSSEEMLRGLRAGKLQIAFVVKPAGAMARGLDFQELARDPLRLAVAPSSPLAPRRSLGVDEAAGEPLIAYTRKDYPEYHDLLTAVFKSKRKKLRIAEEHDSVSSLIAAVEAGCGVALVPESLSCFAGQRLKLLSLSPEPEPLIVGAAWPRDRLDPPAARFLECAKKAAEGIKREAGGGRSAIPRVERK